MDRDKPDLVLTFDKTMLDRLRLGRLTMREGLQSGAIPVDNGPAAEAERFLGYFELPGGAAIQLVLR